MLKKYIFILLCFLAYQPNSKAAWDAGNWNTLDISYRLNKNFAILFTEECRIKYNFTQLNLFYTNIGLEYRMNAAFKTSLVYRQIDKYIVEGGGFSFRHRLMWDATYRYRITPKFSASYRHRLQVENRNILSSEKGHLFEWYSRNKFSLKYDLTDRWSTAVAAEFRYQLHDPRSRESEHTWHRDRYQAGFEYEWSHTISTGAFYLIQREYNVNIPENLSIIGLEMTISLASKNASTNATPSSPVEVIDNK